MGTWTKDSSGVWTHSGIGRGVLIADSDFPAESALKLQLTDYTHGVRGVVLSSKDGRSCFEVGCVGANLVIRSIKFGEPSSVVVHDTAAHGLTAGVPFTLEVRTSGGVIEGRLNGEATPTVSYDNGSAATPLFEGYKHFGFVASVDGAKVTSAQVCELEPIRIERADVLAMVCGGDVFLSINGADHFLLKSGVFPATGDVCLVEFQQKIYAIGGGRARIVDPINLTVEKWVPTDGTLPGQTDDGTTTATILCQHGPRLWLAGSPEDPQNAWACAIDDALDFNTAARRAGRAFALSASDTGRVGQPITALGSCARGSLVIGCNNSIWEFLGDPALGAVQVRNLVLMDGITGKDALVRVADEQMLAHTPNGLYVIPARGSAYKLSDDVLSEGITVPRDQIADYIIQVRRDPRRREVYTFLTKRIADGPSRHVAYEERIGGYQGSNGGFQPDDFLERAGPTASTPEPYQGRLIQLTRDGYVAEFDDDTYSDENGAGDDQAITMRFGLALIKHYHQQREPILHWFSVLLARAGSGTIKYKVWGGLDPEQVYDPNGDRWALLSPGEISVSRLRIERKVRAPAILIELYNDVAGETVEIEDIQALISGGRRLQRRERVPITIGAPCTPPFLTGTGTASGTGTGTVTATFGTANGSGPNTGTGTGTATATATSTGTWQTGTFIPSGTATGTWQTGTFTGTGTGTGTGTAFDCEATCDPTLTCRNPFDYIGECMETISIEVGDLCGGYELTIGSCVQSMQAPPCPGGAVRTNRTEKYCCYSNGQFILLNASGTTEAECNAAGLCWEACP